MNVLDSTIEFLPCRNNDGFCIFGDTRGDNDPLYVFTEPCVQALADRHGSQLRLADGRLERFTDPLGALKALLARYVPTAPIATHPPRLPHLAGSFGYELLHHFERVSLPEFESYPFPYYVVYGYRRVLRLAPHLPPAGSTAFETEAPFWELDADSEQILRHLQSRLLSQSAEQPSDVHSVVTDFACTERQVYQQNVAAVRELIAQGDVYQVNLSQQFRLPYAGDPWKLFLSTLRTHPARYGSFLHVAATDLSAIQFPELSIISQSPELFCECREGNLRVKPIKGTRRRGTSQAEDDLLKAELLSSEKDRAELAMIVDLERNDLGRICKPGSVAVERHAVLEQFSHLFHLVSEVTGSLLDEAGFVQTLEALFPCGSITGAPKIASMEVISQLEGRSRGAYTGAIGAISSERDFLLNVAIRTGVVAEQEFIFNAGGGVVYDSSPTLEYEETLVKAKSLFDGWLQAEAQSTKI